MIKQTRKALSFLLSAYRAVLKHALIAALAAGAVMAGSGPALAADEPEEAATFSKDQDDNILNAYDSSSDVIANAAVTRTLWQTAATGTAIIANSAVDNTTNYLSFVDNESYHYTTIDEDLDTDKVFGNSTLDLTVNGNLTVDNKNTLYVKSLTLNAPSETKQSDSGIYLEDARLFSDGDITVGGNSHFEADRAYIKVTSDSAKMVVYGTATITDSVITTDRLDVADGKIDFVNDNTLNGDLNLWGVDSVDLSAADAALTVNGDVLIVGGSKITIAEGTSLTADHVVIGVSSVDEDATVYVDGEALTVVADDTDDPTSDQITVSDAKTALNGGSDASVNFNSIEVNGGTLSANEVVVIGNATVSANKGLIITDALSLAKGSIMELTSAEVQALKGTASEQTLNFEGALNLNASKIAQNVDLAGVADLTLAGTNTLSNSLVMESYTGAWSVESGAILNIGDDFILYNGSTVTVADGLTVNVADDLILGSQSEGKTTINTLNINGGTLTVAGDVIQDAGIVKVSNAGTFKIIGSDSSYIILGSDLGNAVTVTGANSSLSFAGSTLANSVTYTDSSGDLNTVTSGKEVVIEVSDGADFTISDYTSILTKASDGTFSLKDTLKKGSFDVDSSSTLTISNLGELTVSQVTQLKELLFADADTGNLKGFTMKDVTVDDSTGMVDADNLSYYEGTSGLETYTVDFTSDPTISGSESSGVNTIGNGVVAADTALALGSNAKLTLTGETDNGVSGTKGFLIAEKTSDGYVAGDITLATDATLTISDEGGKIGNITKGSTATGTNLTVTETDVVAGDIDIHNINLKESDLTVTNLKSTSSFVMTGGSLDASMITLQGDSELSGGAEIDTEVLQLSGANAVLKIDPSVVVTDSLVISDGATLAILKDSALIVDNGEEVDVDADLSTTGANLYINSQLDASDGIVYLNGDMENDDFDTTDPVTTLGLAKGDVYLDDNSTLYIGVDAFEDEDGNSQPAVLAERFTVDGGAIKIKGKVKAGEYEITDADEITVNGSTTTSLASVVTVDSVLFSASSVSGDTGSIQIVVDRDKANTYMEGVTSGMKEAIISQAETDGLDENAENGLGYVSRALSEEVTTTERRSVLNGLAGYASAAYAPQVGLMASRVVLQTVQERNGFKGQNSSHIGILGNKTNSRTVWLSPLYSAQRSSSFKMEGSSYGAKTNLYGLALGADMKLRDFKLGVVGSIGRGKAKGRGNIATTNNDFKFYGLGIYGTYSYGQLSVLASLNYQRIKHDASQQGLAGESLKSKFDSDVITLGAEAKYVIKTPYVNVTPHIGMYYIYNRVGKYNIKSGGTLYASGKSIKQHLVQFPLGVTLSHDFEVDRWKVRPVLDVGMVLTAGKRSVTNKLDITGFVDGSSVKARTVDPVTFVTSVSVDAQYGRNFGMGLGYTFQVGSKAKDHVLMGSARYTF